MTHCIWIQIQVFSHSFLIIFERDKKNVDSTYFLFFKTIYSFKNICAKVKVHEESCE